MTAQLIPSVEKRISTWIDLQKKRKQEDIQGKPPRPSITISREFGCEGYPLAVALKTLLDQRGDGTWTIFDDKLVDKIISDHEIARHLVKNIGERVKYIDYIISSLLPAWKSDTEVFKFIVETVFSIAQQGNAILVGRGAFAITKNLSNCYHFRVIAPLEYRAESYAKRAEISEAKAKQIVQEKEEQRTSFLSHFLNCGFEQENFHMIFNNSKMQVDNIAQAIISFVDQ